MSRTTSSPTGRELEKVLAKARALAQQGRDSKGLGHVDATIRRRRDGSRWVGPTAYKMTLWLRPWEYLEVIERMRQERYRGSVTSFLLRGYLAHHQQQHRTVQRARERARVAVAA